jgi:hypothetical protein
MYTEGAKIQMMNRVHEICFVRCCRFAHSFLPNQRVSCFELGRHFDEEMSNDDMSEQNARLRSENERLRVSFGSEKANLYSVRLTGLLFVQQTGNRGRPTGIGWSDRSTADPCKTCGSGSGSGRPPQSVKAWADSSCTIATCAGCPVKQSGGRTSIVKTRSRSR